MNILLQKNGSILTEKEQQDILMKYRLAYCGYGEVNWCEALGTVLANDEVVNGVSERGLSCGEKEIAPMVSAHHRICRPFAGRTGNS